MSVVRRRHRHMSQTDGKSAVYEKQMISGIAEY